jgi:hypothetical protein
MKIFLRDMLKTGQIFVLFSKLENVRIRCKITWILALIFMGFGFESTKYWQII